MKFKKISNSVTLIHYPKDKQGDIFDDSVFHMRSVMSSIEKLFAQGLIRQGEVFCDAGCGVGAVMKRCTRSQRISKLIGVEINPLFADYALQNLLAVKNRQMPVEIHSTNIIYFERFHEPTFFYLFLPFGEFTFRAMMNSILSSQKSHPRSIRIVFNGFTKWVRHYLEEKQFPWTQLSEDMVYWNLEPRLT